MKIVFNSSPLIFLVRLNFLEKVLEMEIDAVIYIPDSVIQEIKVKSDEIYGIIGLEIKRGKFQVKTTGLYSLFFQLNQKLGKGESEAICLGTELQADLVILDDLSARKTAINLGLNVRGTLGIIKRLTQSGKINAANKDELYQKLKDINFRVSRSIFDAVFSD